MYINPDIIALRQVFHRDYNYYDLEAVFSDGGEICLGQDLELDTSGMVEMGPFYVPDPTRLNILFSNGKYTHIEHLGLFEGHFIPDEY